MRAAHSSGVTFGFASGWPKSRVAVVRGNIRYASSPRYSILPEITKPLGGQFRVTYRVLNMAMPEVLLNGARIDAFVCQVKATRMAEHMRMDRKRELGVETRTQNDMADGAIAERGAPFWQKDIGDRNGA